MRLEQCKNKVYILFKVDLKYECFSTMRSPVSLLLLLAAQSLADADPAVLSPHLAHHGYGYDARYTPITIENLII